MRKISLIYTYSMFLLLVCSLSIYGMETKSQGKEEDCIDQDSGIQDQDGVPLNACCDKAKYTSPYGFAVDILTEMRRDGNIFKILHLSPDCTQEELEDRVYVAKKFLNLDNNLITNELIKKDLRQAAQIVDLAYNQIMNTKFPSWSRKMQNNDLYKVSVKTTGDLVNQDVQQAIGYVWTTRVRKKISQIPGAQWIDQQRENFLNPRKDEIEKRKNKSKNIKNKIETLEQLQYVLAQATKNITPLEE